METKDKNVHSYRVKPSIKIAVAIIFMYMAIFSTIWAINGVDYATIGKTLESTKIDYAMTTLIASSAVAIAITALGWWKLTLFDKEKSGPKWAWIGPIAMFLLSVSSLAMMKTDGLSVQLVLFSILGAIGVGFGEEMLFRGGLLVSLRTKFTEEKVWLISTLAFSAFHIPNLFFGAPLVTTLGQLVLTFIMGSLLYSIRRLGGTLLLCMFLHGLWDSSLFLPQATGSKGNGLIALIYPLAIICTIAVIKQNKGKKISVA